MSKPGHRSRGSTKTSPLRLVYRLVCLESGPLLDWKIRQIGTVFEHSRDVLLGYHRALVLAFPLAQIIVRRTRRRAFGHAGKRVELLFAHGNDAAVCAHSDHVQPLVARGIHPVPALEFRRDLLDRAFHPKGLVAADAKRRLLFLDDPRRSPGDTEVDLRPQGNDLFRTCALA